MSDNAGGTEPAIPNLHPMFPSSVGDYSIRRREMGVVISGLSAQQHIRPDTQFGHHQHQWGCPVLSLLQHAWVPVWVGECPPVP